MKYLKNYNNFVFEKHGNYSGIFSVNIDNDTLCFELRYNHNEKPFKVDLMLNDELYSELSIKVPDSDKLENNEFFLNPKIKKEIIDELINQGFITKTGKKSMAGDKETESYQL